MHSTWDATHPQSSHLLQPVAVQTDSGLLPIRRAVGGAKYLPTASWVPGISAHSQPLLGLGSGYSSCSSPPSLCCLWALERLSQGLFLHNLGLLIPQSSFKWRRAEKKLVNTGSHRTVPCIRLEQCLSLRTRLEILWNCWSAPLRPAPPAHPCPVLSHNL